MIKRFLMRTCSCTLEMITYASKTQKIEIAFKNWPINMYNDVRRLKTAKIEGGAYIAPPPRLNRQLYLAGCIGLMLKLTLKVKFYQKTSLA